MTTTIRLLFVTASDKFKSALLTDASPALVSRGNVRGMMEVWSTTVETAGGGVVMRSSYEWEIRFSHASDLDHSVLS